MRLRPPVQLAALAVLALATGARAQTPDSLPAFEQAEVMIPMRDGARLHTLVFSPRGATAPLPILLTRTPYGIDAALNVRNIFEARPADFRVATHRVYRSGPHPSHVSLPVLPE